MSHLHKVLLLFPLLLLCTSSLPAQTAKRVISRESANQLRDDCIEYIAVVDTHTYVTEDAASSSAVCIGFIQGAVDGLHLAMATSNVPRALRACVPEEATTDELIRVTLKFIGEHPEELSHAAASVVWEAMHASYPCPAK